MKQKFELTLAICVLILFALSESKNRPHKKLFPNTGDVLREYYTQNTVNNIIRNDLMRSEIDLNPSRFIILNGLTADKDPNMQRGEINSNDPNPYYPYYDPSQHIFIPRPGAFRHRRNYKDIYQNDKQPYYGPTTQSRIIDTTPNAGVKVNITMGDLTEINPTVENIVELQRQLDNLNNFIAGPKKLLSDEQFMHVYHKDPNAYYDPTNTDIFAKKTNLENTIANLKSELKVRQELETGLNKVEIVLEKGHISVQNKVNMDKEENNNYIAQSFYYPVKGRNPVNLNNTNTNHNTNDLSQKNSKNSNYTDNSASQENIQDTNSTDNSASQENNQNTNSTDTSAIQENNQNTNSTDNSASQENNPAQTESSNPDNNNNNNNKDNSQKKDDSPQTPNRVSQATPILKRTKPDSQGLKTERIRIISMRKPNLT